VAGQGVVSAPLGALADNDTPKKTYFIVVLDGDYKRHERGKDLPQLAWLHDEIQQYIKNVLHVPEDQVKIVYDSESRWDRTLTADRFRQQFIDLHGKVDGNDDVVFMYAGHSVPTVGTKPSDLWLSDGQISGQELGDWLDYLGAERSFVFLETCSADGIAGAMQCRQTKCVSFSSCEGHELGDFNVHGAPMIHRIRFLVNHCRKLGEAWKDARETVIRQSHGQQHPVLRNPHKINLDFKPWTDPTGINEYLGRKAREAVIRLWVSLLTPKVGSDDPNDKIGPAGIRATGYVAADDLLAYRVRFENKATATAPAQQVVVVDRLDANVDASTLQLTAIGFNDAELAIPPGLDHYEGEATVGSDPNPVRVEAALDPATGVITWTLASVDPLTGDLPEDPLAGFLPPNDEAHRGEGYVAFTVRLRDGVADGTEVENQAAIVFDVNEPIWTNVVVNRVGEPPVGVYLPLVVRGASGSR
jgi:hypothetical protein